MPVITASAAPAPPEGQNHPHVPVRLPVRVPLVTQPLSLLQSVMAARRNLLSILPDLATRQPAVSGRTGGRWHMVMAPAAIRTVLLERLDDYPKSTVTKNLLEPAIGDSLFIAEGAHWRWQRRAAAPVFTHRNVTNLGPVMTAAADAASARVAAVAGRRAIDMAAEMVAATFDVISAVTFADGAGFDRAAVHRAIDGYIAEAGRISLLDVLGLPNWIPRPGRMASAGGMRAMKRMADVSIDARRHGTGPAVPDLLDLLLAAEDPETRRRMSTAELRDNLLTFIVAGHETTALTLGWALYLCAFDPAEQALAHTEARAVLGPRAATAADLPALPRIRAIVDEALRLYPPAGIISRTARKPDTLAGCDIRAGDTVMIPIYALHRNRLLWDDPDAFRPARFLGRKPERFGYLPFGDGPRICIGASFALQEAVIILATLLARFRFAPVPGRDPAPVMILTLRPEGGVWLTADPV